MGEQELDRPRIAVVRGGMQRRPASPLDGVRVRTGFEEQCDDGRVPGARGRVERRPGHPSRARHVRIRAARQQQADGLVLPEERGEVQRGESVAAPASRQVRVVGEEDGEPVEVAERRGLEGIE